ncbi:MAG: tetratricopeptide repeat protein [Candidatus Gastranaerophilaceae bacterium]
MLKKKFPVIILILTIAFSLLFLSKVLPSIYLNAGKIAYRRGNYKEACSEFKMAVRLNPKNVDARYYYVQALIKLPPTLKVQKELYEISQENLSDSADLIADRQISKWKNRISFDFGENYIEQVTFDNKILRWDKSKFPITVNVESTSSSQLPEYYEIGAKLAFVQWQISTNNFIRFKFVNNPQKSQIIVKFAPIAERKNCSREECKYIVAYTMPTIKGNLLNKMDITFYKTNNLNQHFAEKEVYNTTLHEIGHALGIMGHSYNKGNLMYMQSNQNIFFNKFRSNFQMISPQDLNTLMLLYRLAPDITNTPLSQFNTSHQIFAPIVLGSEKQINSRKILEAQNYINAAPKLPNGYIDLSSAYLEEKEYNSAIEATKKALEFSSTENDKFIVYYNFAVIYMNLREWDNSLKYAELAKQIQPSSASDVDALISKIKFNRKSRGFAKKIYTQSLEKNPANINDSISLTKIYLRELNLAQAGKTLNHLIAANPKAKSDPRLEDYRVLIFLFK